MKQSGAFVNFPASNHQDSGAALRVRPKAILICTMNVYLALWKGMLQGKGRNRLLCHCVDLEATK